MGKVSLVGAGPGDISLLTCKGVEVLQQADCVLYDRLVDPQVLHYTKDDCECIYVGKQAQHHTMKQADINALLVEKANQYEHVVRLKGGDVYVFGRGGEEALYLQEHGIQFAIVPGISSCIAALAYAGIPITHRGIASGFHVISAHHKESEFADIDWQSMKKDDQTYVFLMGLSKLSMIVENLVAVHKDIHTPVAIISNATLPSQEVVVSTLGHIEKEMQQQPLSSPAIIVIGNVVKLRNQLNFFEELPLFHAHIVLPQIGIKPSKLSLDLQALGASVENFQVSEIIAYPQSLHEVCLKDFNYLIFTSKNAVKYFMEYLQTYEIDIRMLSHMHIVVIGKATRNYIKQFGLYADIMPKEAHSKALYECLTERLEEHDSILFPRAHEENNIIEKLKRRCRVKEVTLYENRKCEDIHIENALITLQDMVVFHCSSAVHHFMEALDDVDSLCTMDIISIGETTSKTLKSYGIQTFYQAEDATYEAVKNKVIEVWEEQKCIEEED